MKFYGREEEIAYLRKTLEQSNKSSRFTIVTGRRRAGKTTLIRKAYENERLLYFFVARKAESELCESFYEEMESSLGLPMPKGNFRSFADLFEYLMKLSCTEHFTLFIDEFPEFFRVNPSIFSEMQKIWDEYEKESKINLVVSGSVNSMMNKIFKDEKEPLYGRNTGELKVRPFSTSILKTILSDAKPDYSKEDLLALYSFTGGVAKYVQLIIDEGAFSKDDMINYIIGPNSPFITEGKNYLIEEFGKDYGVYFSVLSCISRGAGTRSGIEDIIGREIGGYLTNLETNYEIITKVRPMFEKTSNKSVRYAINDEFYSFWFRFIFKYSYIIEIENYRKLREIVNRDYETFSGLMLERYFHRSAAESGKYTRISRWWDRKGENEIDMIAEDELSRTVEFYEIKRKASNISPDELKRRSDTFLRATHQYKEYAIKCVCLSMNDM